MQTVLLVHPPVAKPSEPPAGVARLSGALWEHSVAHEVLDLNLECLLALLCSSPNGSDTWTRRALRSRERNLHALRTWDGYRSVDRYRRSVNDLRRLLNINGVFAGGYLSFSDYQHPYLSPLRSNDLIRAAEDYETNPFYPFFSRRIITALEETGADVVGFSLNYLSQALCTFAMIGFIRNIRPRVRIVIGGGLVTSWIRGRVWKDQFLGLIDEAVSGAGEYQLLSILGVSANQDRLYPPSFHCLPMDQYLAPGPVLPYSSSAGCYWGQCTFCPERAEGTTYRQISKAVVTEELRSLTADISATLLHLTDNAISPSILETICSHPPGPPWYGFVRLTHHLADPEFCRMLRDSGCIMLKLGLESGSQAVLDSTCKGNNLAESSRILRSLKTAGIDTYVYLLFGTPAETESEARKTLEFVVEHGPYIDYLNMAMFNLPIHSPYSSMLDTKGFYDGDLALYIDFVHPHGWDRKLVRQFLEKVFKRHPAVRSILNRHPVGFGSNHAPFFSLKGKSKYPPSSR